MAKRSCGKESCEIERLMHGPKCESRAEERILLPTVTARPAPDVSVCEAHHRMGLGREIAHIKATSHVLFDELRARTRELDNNLYAYRIDLERDNIFVPVHTDKNAARTFTRLVEDRDQCSSRGKRDQAHQVYK